MIRQATGALNPDRRSTVATPTSDLNYAPPKAAVGDSARTVFGQVMGLVALTVGCTALGAYIGRNLSGGLGIAVLHRRLCLRLRPQYRVESRPRATGDHAPVRPRPVARAGARPGRELPTPRRTPQRYGRPRVPPAALSPYSARSATRPAATCPRGRGSCSGRCSALIVFGVVADLRIDPSRELHLVDRRPGDLRRLHDL